MVSSAMVAELVDDVEVNTGSRVDGICVSITSFAVKLGNAVAGSLGIIALTAVGYVANEVQTASTKTGMNLIINVVPGILFLVAGLFMARIRMNREKAAENSKILAERHSATKAM